ncbi:MAG: response regulator [Thalassobaculum sp.]
MADAKLFSGGGLKATAFWRALVGARPETEGLPEDVADGAGDPDAGDTRTSGRVRLAEDGRFLEADAGAVDLLGEAAAEGRGKAIARLRLMVLKRGAGEEETQDAFDHEGRRVEVVLSPSEDGTVTADLSATPPPAVDARPVLELVVDALEYAPIGALRIDEHGRIVGHNRFLSDWLGPGGRNALLGSEFLPLVAEQDRDRIRQTIADADPDGDTSKSIDIAVGDGEADRFASMYVRRPRGDPGQRVIYLIDISEQRSLEVQFAQSQKMQAVGQLAGRRGARLQQPADGDDRVSATCCCSATAPATSPSPTSCRSSRTPTGRPIWCASFSPSRASRPCIPRVVDLTEILSDLSHLLRRLIGETVSLELEHGRDLRPVRVDPGQLEQVIINLVVNARDAMPAGGRIAMRTGLTQTVRPLRQGDEVMPPGEYVLIEVIDTGTGMTAEVQKRIFEPFFTTKDLGHGTGLGLSTAFGIIKQFGGYMFVDSTLEVGTTFSIYLPAWTGAVEAAAGDGHRRIDTDLSGTGTVLLVEDEDPVRLFAARALRGKGYTVLEARSGEAALELLRGENPDIDLMVTDVMMPGIDGPTLIREVRKERPTLPVVCISGYSEDALRQRIADTELVAFLPKPFSLKQLALAVKHATQPRDPAS